MLSMMPEVSLSAAQLCSHCHQWFDAHYASTHVSLPRLQLYSNAGCSFTPDAPMVSFLLAPVTAAAVLWQFGLWATASRSHVPSGATTVCNR